MCILNDLKRLQNEIETPHLIYSEEILERALSAITKSLNDILDSNASIYYAVKSCYNKMVMKTIAQLGAGAEVMSELEYDLSITNGFCPKNILVNGLGRNYEFLEKSSLDGATIIIDSPGDLQKLRLISEKHRNIEIKVGIRINIDLSEFSESPYQEKENKLGVDPTSALFNDFAGLCRSADNVKLVLIHTHTAINQKSPHIYKYVLNKIKQVLKTLEEKAQQNIQTINIGGGFGTYSPEDMNQNIPLFESLAQEFNKIYPNKTLAVEPGRFLSNPCGFVIGEVLDIKSKFSINHIITDASTNTLIPIPTARYKLLHPKTIPTGGVSASITDGVTSPDNMVIHNCNLKELPKIGSKIILGNCGAYTDTLGEFWVFKPFKTSFLQKDNNLISTRNEDDINNACKLYWQ